MMDYLKILGLIAATALVLCWVAICVGITIASIKHNRREKRNQ